MAVIFYNGHFQVRAHTLAASGSWTNKVPARHSNEAQFISTGNLWKYSPTRPLRRGTLSIYRGSPRIAFHQPSIQPNLLLLPLKPSLFITPFLSFNFLFSRPSHFNYTLLFAMKFIIFIFHCDCAPFFVHFILMFPFFSSLLLTTIKILILLFVKKKLFSLQGFVKSLKKL